jgi:hypothetical protein
MITVEEWEKGLQAWKNIKKQAETDIEQAEMFMTVIEKKIEDLKSLEVKNG